jgi:hypothetical protein
MAKRLPSKQEITGSIPVGACRFFLFASLPSSLVVVACSAALLVVVLPLLPSPILLVDWLIG